MRQLRFVAVLLFCLPTLASDTALAPPPATAKQPVTDEYHGVKVVDDYRWLEDWSNPEVKQWSAAQNARTRAYLDHLPSRPAIRQRLEKLMSESSARYFDLSYRRGTLFAMKAQPPKQQPMLIALRSPDEPTGEHVVVDPNALSANGSVAIDFYDASLDGKLVAVSLSENGSEDGTARVFETLTGKELSDRVPRVNFGTAGGSIAWNRDGTGFYYTRYPQGSERPAEDMNFYQQVYFHRLGTTADQDRYVIGKDFPRIAEIRLDSTDDGNWVLASVANGDGGQFAHYLRDAEGHWTQVTHFEDAVVRATLGTANDPALYLLSRQDAPRGKVLRLALGSPNLSKAELIVPTSPGSGPDEVARAAIAGLEPTATRLYVEDVVGGPTRVRIFDHHGRPLGTLPAPEISAVGEVVHTEGDDVLFHVETYLSPAAWHRLDAQTGHSTNTSLVEHSSIQFDDVEVTREFATSRDGTKVPVVILHRKGIQLDGQNPALLTGYGGYGVNLTPRFAGPMARIWLDQGGIYAIANLRGGGEYGDEWHKAGNLTHKQNVFDDFIGACQHLIERRYTAPEHLAILGGSNGGLLMGAVLTERPDLEHAVVSFVGIYDMLRVELDPNGAFNTTEFGTVKNPDEFRALYGYSPYHHVEDGTAYPAVLFLTGENDHRVNPMQSRKMIARLQAANHGPAPILLRTTASAGHGIGSSLAERIEQNADVLSFLFDQLGTVYRPPPD